MAGVVPSLAGEKLTIFHDLLNLVVTFMLGKHKGQIKAYNKKGNA